MKSTSPLNGPEPASTRRDPEDRDSSRKVATAGTQKEVALTTQSSKVEHTRRGGEQGDQEQDSTPSFTAPLSMTMNKMRSADESRL